MDAPASLRRKMVAGLLVFLFVAVVQWVILYRGRMPAAPLSEPPGAVVGK